MPRKKTLAGRRGRNRKKQDETKVSLSYSTLQQQLQPELTSSGDLKTVIYDRIEGTNSGQYLVKHMPSAENQ
eukprot:CAMPEP_0170542660 /NCGR_PEP_ID=MMETSP0211-20121228/2024_1 /TAXON_ID=311385 /ORGANISM="Pseudokeronopsis sp., Strain OXSARD2" /LENGTH=71 /DNA_ID=CAMNT_0010845807 /DNA_START=248 /DNA_END=463 /DNA_ORIENTATION=+